MNSDYLKKALTYLTRSSSHTRNPSLQKLPPSKSKLLPIKSLKQSKQISLSKSISKSHSKKRLKTSVDIRTVSKQQQKGMIKNGANIEKPKTANTIVKRKQPPAISTHSGFNNNVYSEKYLKYSKQESWGIKTIPTTTKSKNSTNNLHQPCYKKKIKQSNKLFESKKSSLSKLVRQLFQTQPSSPSPQKQLTTKQSPSLHSSKDQSLLIHTAISTPSLPLSSTPSIFSHQPQITPRMRCILLDWMLTISSQLHLPRQTTNLAITYLDIYISKQQILKSQLQLCGIACLIIAVKEENNNNEVEVKELLESCGEAGRWSREDVWRMEREVLFSLEWRLRGESYVYWIGYLAGKWNKYVEGKEGRIKGLRFRWKDEGEKEMTQELVQIIDLLVHINDTIHSNKPKSVLALMYLLLRTRLQQPSKPLPLIKSSNKLQHMKQLFQHKITPLFNDKTGVNEMFNEFMVDATGCELDSIFSEIKGMSKYLDFKINYNESDSMVIGKPDCQGVMRLQTHNQNTLPYAMQQLLS